MTGARVPNEANAVQKVELCKEKNGFVEISETAKPKQNIVARGAEIRQGAKVFGAGETVSEQMIAALASFGYAKVKVFRQPTISILATGSEIVNVFETPRKDQIRNSNSAMLAAFAKKLDLKTRVLPLVHDDFETLKKRIAEAVATESQILILTGGVSVGDYDFTKPALRELGAEIFFEKARLKPGKPTVFARLNDCLVFGLPGNPVSVAVTFYLFARKAILRMQSANDDELKKGFAVVSEKVKGAKERDSYLPISLQTNEKGNLTIESLRFSSSSNFIAFARANALIFIPEGKTYERGDVAEVLFL
jgi:molybdenum cofactor synthesis domain-containing protein